MSTPFQIKAELEGRKKGLEEQRRRADENRRQAEGESHIGAQTAGALALGGLIFPPLLVFASASAIFSGIKGIHANGVSCS